MFVSIFQRFSLSASRCAAEPLQSRADQNTREAEPVHQARRSIAVAFKGFETGRQQTHQEIWRRPGLDCPTAVWPKSRRGDPRAIPKRLARGNLL